MAGLEVPGTGVHGKTDINDTRFTSREMSILELIAKGFTNVQIAGELHISKYTVAQHVAKMLERSGAINRTDLVSRSYTAGVLQNLFSPANVERSLRGEEFSDGRGTAEVRREPLGGRDS